MEQLYSPKTVHALLEKYGMRPSKSLGQNFLIDGNILRLMVESGEPETHVFEVGPGLGVLTRELAKTGIPVTAIEKDDRLKPVLQDTLQGYEVSVVWGDALSYDWESAPQNSVLIANLPYYISTAILTRILQSQKFKRATFLVQREVAERLIAKPNTEQYGFLSVLVALYGTAHIVRDVPKQAFYPVPEVTSSIVRIDISGSVPPASMLTLVQAALAHRRKTLRNNLQSAGFSRDHIDQALTACHLPATIRGEALTLQQLRDLHNQLAVNLGQT